MQNQNTTKIYYADGIPEIKQVVKMKPKKITTGEIYKMYRREAYKSTLYQKECARLRQEKRMLKTRQQNKEIERNQNILYGSILLAFFVLGFAFLGWLCNVLP